MRVHASCQRADSHLSGKPVHSDSKPVAQTSYSVETLIPSTNAYVTARPYRSRSRPSLDLYLGANPSSRDPGSTAQPRHSESAPVLSFFPHASFSKPLWNHHSCPPHDVHLADVSGLSTWASLSNSFPSLLCYARFEEWRNVDGMDGSVRRTFSNQHWQYERTEHPLTLTNIASLRDAERKLTRVVKRGETRQNDNE